MRDLKGRGISCEKGKVQGPKTCGQHQEKNSSMSNHFHMVRKGYCSGALDPPQKGSNISLMPMASLFPQPSQQRLKPSVGCQPPPGLHPFPSTGCAFSSSPPTPNGWDLVKASKHQTLQLLMLSGKPKKCRTVIITQKLECCTPHFHSKSMKLEGLET